MKRRTGPLAIVPILAAGTFFWIGPTAATPPKPEVDLVSNDVAAVVAGNNQFAFDLYAHLAREEGNLFLSPSSISTALAMTYAGARGRTADEMANTLHFPLDQGRLHPAFAALERAGKAEAKKRGYQLSVANALWGQKGAGFLPDFLNLTRTHYDAGQVEVDFARDTELARKTINDWVEQQTQNKIKELFKPGTLDSKTLLVLTNAIYFKGDWAAPFQKEHTADSDFQVTADQKVKVPLMHRTGHYPYLDGGTFQALEMPYKGKGLSMLVLLPKKADGLADLEKSLSASRLKEWLAKMQTPEVAVALPKFKMTREFQLNRVLSAMGMPTAFHDTKADFTGMNGTGPRLFLSVVVHKAFVEVNEQGTEAAAGTGVGIKKCAPGPVPETFRADHPFVFLIRANHSGSILFLGRVTNPQS